MRTLTRVACVALLTVPAASQGQPLSGPPIADAAGERTLVRTDYQGRLHALDAPPEEAALELLDLDGRARDAVRRVIAERAAVLDRIVLDNLDLFPQFAAARQAGDKLGQLRLFMEFVRVTEPLRHRGTLAEEVRAVLPLHARDRFDRLVSEYWRAAAADRVAHTRALGATITSREAMRQVRFETLGRELERSYARLSASESFFVEYLLRGLGLSEHQEERIRAIIGEYDARAMRGATEAERAEAFLGVIALLNEKQREAFLERLKGF
ncbi:MAG: hypothetical protein KIS87_00950 [Phycisphaeraceae bacterium]|nr:hypothetical protein [Phycisphaeraceae bacterium]